MKVVSSFRRIQLMQIPKLVACVGLMAAGLFTPLAAEKCLVEMSLKFQLLETDYPLTIYFSQIW